MERGRAGDETCMFNYYLESKCQALDTATSPRPRKAIVNKSKMKCCWIASESFAKNLGLKADHSINTFTERFFSKSYNKKEGRHGCETKHFVALVNEFLISKKIPVPPRA